MFETFQYIALQQYWWIIVSLLGAILVFLMFVQGGQTLIYTLGKSEDERTILVNLLGRKWEITFTTLVTFGGAFFASFPLFYSTSFGGAYWVWMLILIAFVVQAVSYEFRKKPNNLFGHRFYEILLFINGLLGTILGLIESFDSVAHADPAEKQVLLARGIAIAMNTTAFGLIIAIPVLASFVFLNGVVKKIVDEIDQYSVKLQNLLVSRGKGAQNPMDR